jgi:hypothetical protein
MTEIVGRSLCLPRPLSSAASPKCDPGDLNKADIEQCQDIQAEPNGKLGPGAGRGPRLLEPEFQ